jgi:3-hydroxymyristoyl/3-hydroxydecanoyl-(acyl carrier protein) dehydratase
MLTPLDKWLPLRDSRISLEGRWESSVQFGSSSEWFSGHFEGYPLLPAITLLALAAATVKRQGRETGRILEIPRFFRVRFKRFVFPDEKLLISVAGMPPESEANLDFQLTCNGKIVAQGVLKAREGVLGG